MGNFKSILKSRADPDIYIWKKLKQTFNPDIHHVAFYYIYRSGVNPKLTDIISKSGELKVWGGELTYEEFISKTRPCPYCSRWCCHMCTNGNYCHTKLECECRSNFGNYKDHRVPKKEEKECYKIMSIFSYTKEMQRTNFNRLTPEEKRNIKNILNRRMNNENIRKELVKD